jgi:DNA-binding response OmpR family regulator
MARTRHILIAEDEVSTAESIKAGLDSFREFTTEIVPTALDALRSVAAAVPDALLLDTTLPDMSTREICGVLRSRARTSGLVCIMLGERARSIGPIDGFECGADDYLTKPIDPCEVAARLKAVLRRRLTPESPHPDRFHGARICADFAGVAVSVDGVPVSLTLREFRLLRALVGASNQVLSRQALLSKAWGTSELDCRIVDSAMWKLRLKLREAASQIETVTGFGYRFNEPGK